MHQGNSVLCFYAVFPFIRYSYSRVTVRNGPKPYEYGQKKNTVLIVRVRSTVICIFAGKKEVLGNIKLKVVISFVAEASTYPTPLKLFCSWSGLRFCF